MSAHEDGVPLQGVHGGQGAATGPDTTPGAPVFDGEMLSDVENEYVSRWLAYAQAKVAQERGERVESDRSGGPGADGPVGGSVDGEIVDDAPGPDPGGGQGPNNAGAGEEQAPRPSTALVLRQAGAVAGTAVGTVVGTVARQVGHGTAAATVRVVSTARVVATHDRTKTAARWAARNGVLYVVTGLWVVGVRVWEARTNSRYERMMRAAEAAGDQDRLSDWETRAERARERRHRRRMDWINAPFALAQAVAVAGATVAGMLLALGVLLAFAHSDASWILAPLGAVINAVAWAVWLCTVTWLPLL
ncbi:MAG TPA: hypothetical protein VE196_09880, partial [Pseudonocardiaceae bacterium]|nr:hypothetical protein [Pseudonocardiaceae bacterium]